jgi:hypothetical protein
MERYIINKEIRFRSLVPMMTLLLDFLNCEMWTIDIGLVVYCSNFLKEAFNNSNSAKEIFLNKRKKGKERFFKEPEVIYC